MSRRCTRSALAAVLVLAACGTGASDAPDAGADAAPGDDAALARDAGHDASIEDAGPDPELEYHGPGRLSETGLYTDIATRALHPDVRPYAVRFELWSDGAAKQRFFRLPPGTSIDASDPEAWIFPIGTEAWKEFHVGERLVETRYFVKVSEDRWERAAFVWLEDGSDAIATPLGLPDASGTSHDVPDVEGCHGCHRGSADGLIGVSALQLATGESDELLAWLVSEARIAPPPPDTTIPGAPAEVAALGYLHGNCGHCHNERHALATQRSMRLYLPLGLARVADAPVLRTAPGVRAFHEIPGASILLVPGDAEASQIWHRMTRLDLYRMPDRGTEVVDEAGLALLRRWIDGLPP